MLDRFRDKMSLVGLVLSLAAVVALAIWWSKYSRQINFAQFNTTDILSFAGLAAIYGLLNIILAVAWWHLLLMLHVPANPGWAIQTYGTTQLAKYLPGNLFHFVGRQTLGLSAGYAGWALAKSSVWEIGTISVTGAMFSLLAIPLVFQSLPLAASAITFLIAMGAIIALSTAVIGRRVAYAITAYALFLSLSGSIFIIVLMFATNIEIPLGDLTSIGGAYVLAWLLGLVTPGAPAGAGIREIAMIFLLGNRFPRPDILLAIIVFRAVTVSGDLIFFGLSFLSPYLKPLSTVSASE